MNARRMTGRGLAGVVLLWLVPAAARADLDVASLAPFEGRRVTGLELEGNDVTRESVILRELETRVGEPLSVATLVDDVQRLDNLALFVNAGVAWDEAEQFSLRRVHGGLGGGLRILIPGSETRLDVGWSPDGGVHFHFAGGSKPAAQRLRLR